MSQRIVAQLIAERLLAQGVTRIYGLCGGHIQPIWDAADRAGITIVDVRHEGAAVYMAQAESELTGGLGVALLTAGPGLTNAVTAISNASVSRSSVLVISGIAPRPQAGVGAMQDLPQAKIVAPLCRCAASASEAHHVLSHMDRVIAAALGASGQATGPSYIDFPTDLLEEGVHPLDAPREALRRRAAVEVAADRESIRRAVELIGRSTRILVIGGRPVRAARAELMSFLQSTGALYLDSGECRGVIREDYGGYVPALRGRVMKEAGLVITLGRRLDFQLGYGSPAVFGPETEFLRIGTCFEETGENRRGAVEVTGTVRLALQSLLEAGAMPREPDTAWLADAITANARRSGELAAKLDHAPLGSDGRMHPYRLIGAINKRLAGDSVVVADGGDILSFARVGLRPVDYLDCGALGCLGVGVPFAIAAALQRGDGRSPQAGSAPSPQAGNTPSPQAGNTPSPQAGNVPVMAIIGDGSFGFTAIEIDTAVRHRAHAVFVVANNEGWNIERHDQADRYGNLVGVELPGCRYDELARSLGAHGARVEAPEELDGALDRALQNTPAVLDVLVTRDAKSPDYVNGLARVPPRQALASWNESELSRYAPRG